MNPENLINAEEAPDTGQRLTSVNIGDYRPIPVECLLMKLGLATSAARVLAEYADYAAANDGDPGDMPPPDKWAIAGMFKNLDEVAYALKCACWGHAEAYKH